MELDIALSDVGELSVFFSLFASKKRVFHEDNMFAQRMTSRMDKNSLEAPTTGMCPKMALIPQINSGRKCPVHFNNL